MVGGTFKARADVISGEIGKVLQNVRFAHAGRAVL
jgi:hypothetical protein